MDSRFRGNDRRGVLLRRTGGLGVTPNSLISPKIEDPPQEEWGIKGVDNGLQNSLVA